MKTPDLISRLSEKYGITKVESKDLYDSLSSIMQYNFAKETGIAIPGFGTFTIKKEKKPKIL